MLSDNQMEETMMLGPKVWAKRMLVDLRMHLEQVSVALPLQIQRSKWT